MMSSDIEGTWFEILKEEFQKVYFKELSAFLHTEKQNHQIFPPENLVFAAFNYTPFEKVKVVILGQDPYHRAGQANGLCFSVSEGVKTPPSLVNIFKELKSDLGCPLPANGNLEAWARQGVFLLNATLTVRVGIAGSHQKIGWEMLTNAVIKAISDKSEHVVFLLWGNYAKAKAELIDNNKHFVLTAAHPSPLARGAFFNSKPFSKANTYLESKGKSPINWCLSEIKKTSELDFKFDL